MRRMSSLKFSAALGLFLGGSQLCFASFSGEIYRDPTGNFWRPCAVDCEDFEDCAEDARQNGLPLKKRLSMRPDFSLYNPETGIVWHRIYPAPVFGFEDRTEEEE